MLIFRPLLQLAYEFALKYGQRYRLGILAFITAYIGFGTVVYRHAFGTGWSLIDSLYFTMVTISSESAMLAARSRPVPRVAEGCPRALIAAVGYGDLSPGPDHADMQIFTIFYILFGITSAHRPAGNRRHRPADGILPRPACAPPS